MTHSYDTTDIPSVYYKLDGITSVNKAIEKILSESRATHVSLDGVTKDEAINILKLPQSQAFLGSLKTAQDLSERVVSIPIP